MSVVVACKSRRNSSCGAMALGKFSHAGSAQLPERNAHGGQRVVRLQVTRLNIIHDREVSRRSHSGCTSPAGVVYHSSMRLVHVVMIVVHMNKTCSPTNLVSSKHAPPPKTCLACGNIRRGTSLDGSVLSRGSSMKQLVPRLGGSGLLHHGFSVPRTRGPGAATWRRKRRFDV